MARLHSPRQVPAGQAAGQCLTFFFTFLEVFLAFLDFLEAFLAAFLDLVVFFFLSWSGVDNNQVSIESIHQFGNRTHRQQTQGQAGTVCTSVNHHHHHHTQHGTDSVTRQGTGKWHGPSLAPSVLSSTTCTTQDPTQDQHSTNTAPTQHKVIVTGLWTHLLLSLLGFLGSLLCLLGSFLGLLLALLLGGKAS